MAVQTNFRSKKGYDISNYLVQKEKYLNYCDDNNLRPDTIAAYTHHIQSFYNYLVASYSSTKVGEIREDDIRDYLRYLKNERKLKQTSINSALTHLKPFFNYMFKREVISVNPIVNIKKGKVDENPIMGFTSEQVELLLKQPNKLSYVGHRDYCIMLVLASTGARIGELLEVLKSDLNLDEQYITFRHTKNRRTRSVSIPSNVVKQLRLFYNRFFANSGNTCEYFFQSQDWSQLKRRTFQDAITKYGKQAGINDVRVSCHTFRHFYAIHFLENDGNTGNLQAILGHKTLLSTERYLNYSNANILNASKKNSPVASMKI